MEYIYREHCGFHARVTRPENHMTCSLHSSRHKGFVKQ